MPIENSNFIILILTAIILALIIIVIKVNIQFYNEKKSFKKKVEVLGEIIVQMSNYKLRQQDKVKLSEELSEKLKTFNSNLSSDIFELNWELFELLSKNKLV